MVRSDIVTYLTQGKERGFELSFLKKNLLNAGFQLYDVDEAIHSLPSQPIHTTSIIKQSSSSELEELSFFNKLVYICTHPWALVERTRDERFSSTFLFNELLTVVPFMIIALGLMLTSQLAPTNVPLQVSSFFSQLAAGSFTFFLFVLALTMFIVLPLSIAASALCTHLMVKLVRGNGLYRETYKSIVYGTALAFLVVPVLLVLFLLPPAGLLVAGSLIGVTFIGSFIMISRALAFYHELSPVKAFIASFFGAMLSLGILAGLVIGVAYLSSQPPQFGF